MESVYFLSCAGRIKIGKSLDVSARVKEISTHLFDEVILLGQVPGGYALETAIHKRLRAYRLRNEWFEDCEHVRSVCRNVIASGRHAVAEFYTASNRAHGHRFNGREEHLRSGSNPWRLLAARLDDLSYCLGQSPARVRAPGRAVCTKAWLAIREIHRHACEMESDDEPLIRASALVGAAQETVRRMSGVVPVFTQNSRITLKPVPAFRADALDQVSFSFDCVPPFEAGLTAGLVQ